MAMQINNQLYIGERHNPPNFLLDIEDLRTPIPILLIPIPIQIKAHGIAPIIAQTDPIDVNHWNYINVKMR